MSPQQNAVDHFSDLDAHAKERFAKFEELRGFL
jgi:hypothetical protein